MLMPDRQSAILKAVTEQGSCRVAALAAALGVSGETIRRDVAEMARDGLVRKVHGGVGLPDPLRESGFRHRLRQNADAKRRIAQAAAREIRDGDAIMMDTGSTTAFVAEALHDHRGLTVMTNSVDIAHGLATRNGNRVFMAGGELRADDGAALGRRRRPASSVSSARMSGALGRRHRHRGRRDGLPFHRRPSILSADPMTSPTSGGRP